MHKIDGPGHVNNTFSDLVDPDTGQFPTIVKADWLNAMQAELVSVATAMGTPLSKPNTQQVKNAIVQLIGAAVYASELDMQAAFDALQTSVTNQLAAMAPHITQLLGGRWLHTTEFNATYYVKPEGQSLLRSDYPAAWAAIQASGQLAASHADWLANPTLWGPGVDGNHFDVKDLRDVFLRVYKGGKGGALGPLLGMFKGNQNKAHTHPFPIGPAIGSTGEHASPDDFSNSIAQQDATGSSGGDEAVPDHTALIYVIRLK